MPKAKRKTSRKTHGGTTKAQLKKIFNKAASLREMGRKPGPALKTAWADFKAGKL